MSFVRHSISPRTKGTACAAAIFAALLPHAAGAQEFGRVPISSIVVGGLDTAAGAKILLIRAAGDDCSKSVLLPVDAASATAGEQYYSTSSGNGKDSASPLLYRTAIHVDANCWCKDPNAGFGVMAPDRAVSYRMNGAGFRPPSEREARKSAANQPFFQLCGPDPEIRVDLRPRREVPVVVWAADGDARAMAKDELANLDWILDKALAGVTVRPAYRVVKAPFSLQKLLPTCYPDDDEDACCDSVQTSRLFDSGALNLYYGAGNGNFTCPDVPASFVHDNPILGDAAHELSHALGLNQSDHEVIYDSGHTTDASGFDWNNVMWEHTQFLKNALSPAQAFWMSQSCSSWLGLNNSCLNCTDREASGVANASSPCPPLSLGSDSVVAPNEKACTGSPACDAAATPENALLYVPAREKKPSENCERPLSIYKDGKTLESHLKDRYSVLRNHVHGRTDLALGSVNSFDFLRRWEPSFAYNIAPVDSNVLASKNSKEQDTLPHALFIRSVNDLRKKPLPACVPAGSGSK